MEPGAGADDDADAVGVLQLGELLAVLVLHEVCELGVQVDAHLGEVARGGLALDAPQEVERHEFGGRNRACAAAGWAVPVRPYLESLLDALAVDLQQSVVADLTHVGPGLVRLEGFLDLLLDPPVVFLGGHVDEIHHQQPAQVAQTQLTADLPGGFQVGLVGGLFLALLPGGLGAVHVDGGQRFGGIDADRASRGEVDLTSVDGFDLFLEAVAREQRLAIRVQRDVALGTGHHRAEIVRCVFRCLPGIDGDLVELRGVVVADHADDQVTLLVEQRGPLGPSRFLVDTFVQLEQAIEVTAERRLGLVEPGGAHDVSVAFGDIELGDQILDLGAHLLVLDLPADAPGARVGHQHHEPASQRDIGGECGALVADGVAGDLYQDGPPPADDIADAGPTLAPGFLVVVLARDVVHGQESLAGDPDLHETGIEARLGVGDRAFVDIAFDQVVALGEDLESFEFSVTNDSRAHFFGPGCVDQHHEGHGGFSSRFGWCDRAFQSRQSKAGRLRTAGANDDGVRRYKER